MTRRPFVSLVPPPSASPRALIGRGNPLQDGIARARTASMGPDAFCSVGRLPGWNRTLTYGSRGEGTGD